MEEPDYDGIAEQIRLLGNKPNEALVDEIRSRNPSKRRRYDTFIEELRPLSASIVALPSSVDSGRNEIFNARLSDLRRSFQPDLRSVIIRWFWKNDPTWLRKYLQQWNVILPLPNYHISSETDDNLSEIGTESQPRDLVREELSDQMTLIEIGRPDYIEGIEVEQFSHEYYVQKMHKSITQEYMEKTGRFGIYADISILPDRIRHMTWLEKFDMSDSEIEEFDFLSNMTHLKELDISSTLIKDLNVLKSCTSLVELNLDFTNIESLEVLKYLKNLKVLRLGVFNGDLSPILELEHLEMLEVETEDEDIIETILNSLHKLKELEWAPEFFCFLRGYAYRDDLEYAKYYFKFCMKY